jgi:hypothetical protein
MALSHDPYSPPAASLDGPPGQGGAEVSGSVVAILAETRPWVKLMAILFFVSLGLMGVVFVGMTVVGTAMGGAQTFATLIPAMLMMLLFIPPSVFLWRYHKGIRRLQDGGGQGALEEALRSQKSYWKYVGILMAVVLCLYALIIVGAIFFGALGTMLRPH